jgi:hypothetical protein
MYRYLHHEHNSNYARRVAHRFTYTDVWVNLCEDAYNASDVRRTTPIPSATAYIIASPARSHRIARRTCGPGLLACAARCASGRRTR